MMATSLRRSGMSNTQVVAPRLRIVPKGPSPLLSFGATPEPHHRRLPVRVRSVDPRGLPSTSAALRGQQPQPLGDGDGLRERMNLELFHHHVTVGLDGSLRRAQLVGDMLVEFPAYEDSKDLALPLRERGYQSAELVEPVTLLSPLLVAYQGSLDGFEQRGF